MPAQIISSSGGQLVLATQLGRVTVQSAATFTPGTLVLLQVQSVGETTQITLQLQQSPLPPQGSPQGGAGANAGAAVPQPSAPVTTHLTEGSVIQAVVTRGAAPVASAPAASAPAAAAPGTAPVQPGIPVPGGEPAIAAQTTVQPAAAPLVNGANLILRVAAVIPPDGEPAPAAELAVQAGARLIAATVIAHRPGGAPVATAGPLAAATAGGAVEAAEIVLSNAPALPTGSRLLLELLDLRAPAGDQSGLLLPASSGRWEALNDAYALLQRLDPSLARQVADGVIPAPGPRLAGSMLFFLSAVFSGDVRRFLGNDAMRQLSRAPGGAAARLSNEIGQMQRTATDAAGQDWRLFLVPVMTEEGLEQVRFLLRDNEGDGKKSKEETGTRFMIEVTMSRLGPFQFDGLARKKHLDLVIRTQNELPKTMVDDIRSIFGNTVTALGLTGTVAFRTVPKFDIAPVEQTAASHRDLTV